MDPFRLFTAFSPAVVSLGLLVWALWRTWGGWRRSRPIRRPELRQTGGRLYFRTDGGRWEEVPTLSEPEWSAYRFREFWSEK